MTLSPAHPNPARRRWMAVLARATTAKILNGLADCPDLPDHIRLRGPETGLVMLRGRAGGAGQRFNLGEATVTRCSIRDEAGRVGHSYATGRDSMRSELAARIDAAMQDPALHDALEARVIAPLEARQNATRAATARRAAATRVDFFSMATMRS